MTIFAAPDEDLIWRTKEIPSPLEVLGANLAVWLESRSGTGPGPNVTTWVNKVAGNGNAIQAPNPDPAVLVQRAFGRQPGVSFSTAGAGLQLHLTTPWAIGNRPYMVCRAQLGQAIHTPGEGQTLFQLVADPPGADESFLEAEATGTFDINAYIDYEPQGQDVFETFSPPNADKKLLATHTIQAAFQQNDALVVDGVASSTPGAVSALAAAVNRLCINRNATIGGRPGFWTIGVMIFTYTQPTAAQISDLVAYCDNYATIVD